MRLTTVALLGALALAAGSAAGAPLLEKSGVPAFDGSPTNAGVASASLLMGAQRSTLLRGTITDVVDGDTVKVEVRGFETTVRLIGIDTPETRHPSKPVQCFGPAASTRAKRLLPVGQRVRLETDPTQDVRDRYGRLLAYVYRPGRAGPRGSVNHALVASGHARAYVYDGVRFRHAGAFLASERRARLARRGLWGPPCNGNTTKPDRPTASAVPSALPARSASPAGCDPNYAGACVPRSSSDLDCDDVPASRFRSVGSDPHRFDRDSDGIACED